MGKKRKKVSSDKQSSKKSRVPDSPTPLPEPTEFISKVGEWEDQFLSFEEINGVSIGCKAYAGTSGIVLYHRRNGKIAVKTRDVEGRMIFRHKDKITKQMVAPSTSVPRLLLTLFHPIEDDGIEWLPSRKKGYGDPNDFRLECFEWTTRHQTQVKAMAHLNRPVVSICINNGKRSEPFKNAGTAGRAFGVEETVIRKHANKQKDRPFEFEGKHYEFEFIHPTNYPSPEWDHRVNGWKTIDEAPRYELHEEDFVCRRKDTHRVIRAMVRRKGYATFSLRVGETKQSIQLRRNRAWPRHSFLLLRLTRRKSIT
jgi:hypothetical protein